MNNSNWVWIAFIVGYMFGALFGAIAMHDSNEEDRQCCCSDPTPEG